MTTMHRTMHRRICRVMAAAALLAGPAVAAPNGPVPVDLRGTWVVATAGCNAALRLQVGADRITFEHGGDRESLGGIEMAGPGYFPAGYGGIMAVLITEFDGHQPVTVVFNADEKKGVARAEFAPPMPGKATPMLKAYNARVSALRLATRFPLDKVALKKCPG